MINLDKITLMYNKVLVKELFYSSNNNEFFYKAIKEEKEIIICYSKEEHEKIEFYKQQKYWNDKWLYD